MFQRTQKSWAGWWRLRKCQATLTSVYLDHVNSNPRLPCLLLSTPSLLWVRASTWGSCSLTLVTNGCNQMLLNVKPNTHASFPYHPTKCVRAECTGLICTPRTADSKGRGLDNTVGSLQVVEYPKHTWLNCVLFGHCGPEPMLSTISELDQKTFRERGKQQYRRDRRKERGPLCLVQFVEAKLTAHIWDMLSQSSMTIES